jgi:hypothetical protein
LDGLVASEGAERVATISLSSNGIEDGSSGWRSVTSVESSALERTSISTV